MPKSNATWNDVDVASIPEPTGKLYKEIGKATEAFEASFTEMARKELGDTLSGKVLKFGYNYGKLSFAIVDPTSKKVFAFAKPVAKAK